jgi:hypothetical protein
VTGAAGSAGAAFEEAAPHLAGSAEAVVEEAVLAMLPAGVAGLVSVYERTGKAWRGRLEDGAPSWEQVEPEALAG